MATTLSTLAPIVQAGQTATAALGAAASTAQSLSNLIVASPQNTTGYQPQNPSTNTGQISNQGPSFVFNYEGEQSVTLESDITDHFTETNSPIQDQIALRPPLLETHGFIGELNNVPPKALAALQQVANTLTVIDAYVPQISATATLAYLAAFAAYQTAINTYNAAVSAWSSVTGNGNGENVITGLGANSIVIANAQTKQAQAFQQWWGWWNNRILFTVQTPWAVFQNVAIQRVKPVQDETTKTVTDFNVVFKLMNFASTNVAFTPTAIATGRLSAQSAPQTNLGVGALSSSSSFSSALGTNFSLPGAP